MNFNEAIKILELQENFTKKDLKKAYYKNAIKYHPDKNNGNKDKEAIFRKVNEAYIFLSDENNKNIDELDTSFSSILKRFFDFMAPDIAINKKDINNTMNAIIKKCTSASITLFEKLSKERSLEIYTFLSKNKETFSIDAELLENMANIIKNKIKNDNIIILNPDINDLLNDKIYKLEHFSKTFYIPLWFGEVVYEDCSGNDIIINCIPELKENLYIDEENVLHVNIKENVKKILHEKELSLFIGEKLFKISADFIKITKHQMLKIKNKGILKQNFNNLFDDSYRNNIFIHLTLE